MSVLLRPRDGIYGIDSHQQETRENQILIDLGKTMERMLTMSEHEFKSLMMKPLQDATSIAGGEAEDGGSFWGEGGGGGRDSQAVETVTIKEGVGVEPSRGAVVGGRELARQGAGSAPEGAGAVPEGFLLGAYNYSKSEGFMLRSQLDCIYGGNQIFDIKTRATHAIRNCFNLLPDVPSDQRHLHFLDYKITQQAGLWNSFEREHYDMIRAAFIKYASQCRIGRMDGAFVTYHNTQEIFGFQYVPLKTMDKHKFSKVLDIVP